MRRYVRAGYRSTVTGGRYAMSLLELAEGLFSKTAKVRRFIT
jgi:hypothetical protein